MYKSLANTLYKQTTKKQGYALYHEGAPRMQSLCNLKIILYNLDKGVYVCTNVQRSFTCNPLIERR